MYGSDIAAHDLTAAIETRGGALAAEARAFLALPREARQPERPQLLAAGSFHCPRLMTPGFRIFKDPPRPEDDLRYGYATVSKPVGKGFRSRSQPSSS